MTEEMWANLPDAVKVEWERLKADRDHARWLVRSASAILREWIATPFFAERNDWFKWVDDVGARVRAFLAETQRAKEGDR